MLRFIPLPPRLLYLLLGLLTAQLLGACKNQDKAAAAGPQKPAAVPVLVQAVAQQAVPIELEAVGHVEASSTVEITAQVDGKLEKVHFAEGDEVKQGELLFSLDAKPFRAALAEAQAQLQRDTSLAKQADLDRQRAEELANAGIAPAQEKERATTNSAALGASLSALQAAVEAARIKLQYTTIRAPIDGRAGSLLVHEGNVVRANATQPLVVLRCVKPVEVRFSLPEVYLNQVRERMRTGEVGVVVEPQGAGKGEQLNGKLTFVDNTVDVGSGTIALKAELANEQEQLWPGQQVTVRVHLGVQADALVVPESAVQVGQNGAYAYVISGENTAELRQLTVARTVEHLSVVTSGLKLGETVAVDGLVRLSPGASVTPSTPATPGEPAPSAAPSASADPPKSAP